MKRIILGLMLMPLVIVTGFAQSTQLSKWFATPNELDLQSTTPQVNVLSGAPTLTAGYNSYYEAGQLLFYVDAAAGKIYNRNYGMIAQLFGGAPVSNEVSIFPHSENFTNLCSKKYWIIYNVKYPLAPYGNVYAGILDMNTSSFTGNVYSFGASDRNDCPFAVGMLNSIGQREIYMQYSSSSSESIRKFGVLGSSIYPIGGGTAFKSFGKEMELSNDGSFLAYVNQVGEIQIVDLTTSTLLATISNVSDIAGLEFDDSGFILYYSGKNNTIPGVYSFDVIGQTSSIILGTTNYATGMLEKSFAKGSLTSQIICGNATTISGIDPLTNLLGSWTAPFSGLLMPDQVDGEDADDKIFWLGYPYRSRCDPAVITTTINYHPYITAYFTPYFNPVEIEYIGNYAGLTTPAHIATVPLSAVSYSYFLNATSSFRYTLSNVANPACQTSVTYSSYVSRCVPGIKVRAELNYSTMNSAMVIAGPANPEEEAEYTNFHDEWYVSDISPENYMPSYIIADPSCWQVPQGEEHSFAGFDPINQLADYKDKYITTSLDCSKPIEGDFELGHEYVITRVTWADDLELTEDVVFVSIPAEADGFKTEPSKPNTFSTRNSQSGSMSGEVTGVASQTAATDQILIYPNPGTGKFMIATTGEGSMDIYDALGKKVKQLTLKNNTNESSIDLSGMPKGIYIVNLTSNNSVTTQKLILE